MDRTLLKKSTLIKIIMAVYDIIAMNFACYISIFIRYYVAGNLEPDAARFVATVGKMAPLYAVIGVGLLYWFRAYDIMWEYGGLRDVFRIFCGSLAASAAYFLVNRLFFEPLPISSQTVGAAIQFCLLIAARFAYKLYLEEKNQRFANRTGRRKTLIVGVGSVGHFVRRLLEESGKVKTVCMLDADGREAQGYVDGVPVVSGLDSLESAIHRYRVSAVVIADNALSEEDKKTVKDFCTSDGIEVVDYIEYLQNNNDERTPIVLASDSSDMRVVPFSPPDISNQEIEEVKKALQSGWITTGPRTKELEKRLAEYCGTSKVVCLNSATAAEELNFRVCGIGEGDEVIVPAYTYTATASAAIHCGAKVIFVDSQKDNCEMDYSKVEEAITEKTKAIVAVDLGGIVADYDKLFEIAIRKRNLFKAREGDDLGARIQQSLGRVLVFADCAHALGASRGGKMTGSIADFTDFSFHAVKNFTTAEGGASTWRDIPGISNDEIYHQYQLYSLHGQSKDALAKTKVGAWEYDIIGPWYKCNMTDIMAAIGLRQLDRYPGMLKRRKEIIAKYDAMCDEMGVLHLTHYTDSSTSSGHLYLTRIPGIGDEERRKIITELAEHGVMTNVHYKPLPMMTAYIELGWDIKDFPNAYDFYANLITLPLHTKLSDADVEYVIRNYKEIVGKYIKVPVGAAC